MAVPAVRIRVLGDRPARTDRAFVLYWMTSFRRAHSNFALDRALEYARAFESPLVVFEPLRVGYPFASDRLHAFVLQGMADNARRFAGSPVHYFPWVETKAGEGKGLLEALASRACVVIGDDWPGFFVPAMQAAAAKKVDVRFEVVDSNGLYPMHATERVFTTAHSFRTHLQKDLPRHLAEFPSPAPLEGLKLPTLEAIPKAITARWPRASPTLLAASDEALASLPIDHSVGRVSREGGSTAAQARLKLFVAKKLVDYAEARNEPEVDGTSALSPWLHFGHLSVHEVFAAIVKREHWQLDSLGRSIGGAKAGWWKLEPSTEAFLDELVTWRELAFNMASHRPDAYRSLDSLAPWAKQTIAAHAKDRRPHLATLEQLEHGQTHDPLWNATQGQLVTEGWFHNYLRMLWGKKIYEWSASAQEALERMEHLMGKYSLDGRDPVSWSGYLWVMGRYDRAWGPERSIFGKLRYMTSENTAKKVHVKGYVERYGRGKLRGP
jgi:deoxyribodipyrimidine photo-lyase